MLSTWTSQNSFFIVPCTRLPVRYWLTEFSVLALFSSIIIFVPYIYHKITCLLCIIQRKIGCQKWQDVSKIYSLTFISEIIAFPANKCNLENLSFQNLFCPQFYLWYHPFRLSLAALLHNNDSRVSKQQVARLISDCFLSTLCAFMIMIGSDNLEKWS